MNFSRNKKSEIECKKVELFPEMKINKLPEIDTELVNIHNNIKFNPIKYSIKTDLYSVKKDMFAVEKYSDKYSITETKYTILDIDYSLFPPELFKNVDKTVKFTINFDGIKEEQGEEEEVEEEVEEEEEEEENDYGVDHYDEDNDAFGESDNE